MGFRDFAHAVDVRWREMCEEDLLYSVDIDKDRIWEIYLGAFPEGTDPIFRVRTEHNCSCCRHFIRSVGGVVAIQNGAISTIWDLSGLPAHYQAVADTMAKYIRTLPIVNVYLTKQPHQGTAVSHEHRETGGVHTWHHFFVEVPRTMVHAEPESRQSDYRAVHAVLMRGAQGLEPEALETISELIEQGSLYRGEEHASAVSGFRTLQERIRSARDPSIAAWQHVGHSNARFRNTVIGTLAQDLSEGADLEVAVRAFEAKVAPQNYRRPTALITRAMVERAMEKIRKLGIESSLERRHARFSDMSVQSVLFVDNSARQKMQGGLEGLLMEEVRARAPDPERARQVSMEEFVREVLPRTTSIEVLLENRHVRNLVSMTAPVHDDAPPILRWNNNFAWSYVGNVTDSIRERVKRAGGQVEGVRMRFSLAWRNTDDLDIHVTTPGGRRIWYGNKMGLLDVDMNVRDPVRDAVENVRWIRRPEDGIYTIMVDNYYRRESIDVGFEIEIESSGQLHSLRSERSPAGGGRAMVVAQVQVSGGVVASIDAAPGIVRGSAPQEHWGLRTQETVQVDSVLLSPNHWDEPGVGNRHWFFILSGCRCPEPVRGIYNEFLSPRLQEHRKVMEVLGEKTKCPYAEEQLSGVGFSSTRRDEVTASVAGPRLRETLTIQF